jgi:hypothetical protein
MNSCLDPKAEGLTSTCSISGTCSQTARSATPEGGEPSSDLSEINAEGALGCAQSGFASSDMSEQIARDLTRRDPEQETGRALVLSNGSLTLRNRHLSFLPILAMANTQSALFRDFSTDSGHSSTFRCSIEQPHTRMIIKQFCHLVSQILKYGGSLWMFS